MTDQLIELDSRRRAAFGRIGRAEHTRYLVTEEPDGTLILTPAVVMAAHEAALLRQPELLRQIQADSADPTRRVVSSHRRPRN